MDASSFLSKCTYSSGMAIIDRDNLSSGCTIDSFRMTTTLRPATDMWSGMNTPSAYSAIDEPGLFTLAAGILQYV